MNTSKKNKLNFILIPKRICHKMNWHSWFWTSRNRSFISGQCARCGMRGNEFWDLQKAENEKQDKRLRKK